MVNFNSKLVPASRGWALDDFLENPSLIFPPVYSQRRKIRLIECNAKCRFWAPNSIRLHRKKRFTSFPSPAGMSLTKIPLGRNNSVISSLFPPRESLVVTSRLGTGNSRTFFLRCNGSMPFHRAQKSLDFQGPTPFHLPT
jgi:hypothetical protein